MATSKSAVSNHSWHFPLSKRAAALASISLMICSLSATIYRQCGEKVQARDMQAARATWLGFRSATQASASIRSASSCRLQPNLFGSSNRSQQNRTFTASVSTAHGSWHKPSAQWTVTRTFTLLRAWLDHRGSQKQKATKEKRKQMLAAVLHP